MPPKSLTGMRLLLLEDEVLIAMDVEQLCLDEGAEAVVTCRDLAEARSVETSYDAAVVDVMLNGETTLSFAAELKARNIPFIFASGYTEREDLKAAFPDIPVVGKPYSGADLIAALSAAIAASSGRG